MILELAAVEALLGIAIAHGIIQDIGVPQTHSFGYVVKDERGHQQFREESGVGGHAVKGSYGFRDDRGNYRRVNYVADENGFRSQVLTDEPVTANFDPATAIQMIPYPGTLGPGGSVLESYGSSGYRVSPRSHTAGASYSERLPRKGIFPRVTAGAERQGFFGHSARGLAKYGAGYGATGLDHGFAGYKVNHAGEYEAEVNEYGGRGFGQGSQFHGVKHGLFSTDNGNRMLVSANNGPDAFLSSAGLRPDSGYSRLGDDVGYSNHDSPFSDVMHDLSWQRYGKLYGYPS